MKYILITGLLLVTSSSLLYSAAMDVTESEDVEMEPAEKPAGTEGKTSAQQRTIARAIQDLQGQINKLEQQLVKLQTNPQVRNVLQEYTNLGNEQAGLIAGPRRTIQSRLNRQQEIKERMLKLKEDNEDLFNIVDAIYNGYARLNQLRGSLTK